MFENFCPDDIWNTSETWNTEVPEFSTCFQDILLVFIPSTVFIIIGFLNLFLISRYMPLVALPWTWRNVLKLIACIILLIISCLWCGLHLYRRINYGTVALSTVTASFARSLIYAVIICLILKHRIYGIATSTVLSIFWICFTICGVIMHRTVILNHNSQDFLSDWDFIIAMLYYPFIYLELIMSFFVDTKHFNSLENAVHEEVFLSNITYIWFNKIVYRGIKRLLTVQDFLPLPVKLKASYLFHTFSSYWKFNLSAAELQKQNLSFALLKSFWPWLLAGGIFDMVYMFLILLPPLILDRILEFVQDDYYLWRRYFYCFILFIASFGANLVLNNSIMYLLSTVAQIRSCLTCAIYRKNLLLCSSARKDFTSGSITSLISVDTQRISQFALYVTDLVNAPIRIFLILFLMWQYLGPSCLAGAAVIVITIPISLFMSRKSEKYTEKQMVVKDIRLKYLNEILCGIKILKFYAWEVPFSSKISNTRKEEIKMIRLSQFCYVITSFIFNCAPALVSVASFATFVLVDSKNILDPTRAFVSLTLLDNLRYCLFVVPDAISELIQTMASLDRIKKFLGAEECNQYAVDSNPDIGDAVTFRQTTLYWSEESNFYLKNINLHVPQGKLIAVIGPVGCGKSSLLSALLGEMRKLDGSISLKGSVAYVSQEAWILNRTLKNNILLEKPMQEGIYNKILDCCCLRPDLEILPGKDSTEIGEKGINLSGGQKQRISLARAVFQNKDIYLMDDPLSALDSHVRKAIFDDVISDQGILRNKTRILVTHDTSFLSRVDSIICMNEGKIVEIGSYSELCQSQGTLSKFIETYEKFNEDKPPSELNVNNEKLLLKKSISEDYSKPHEFEDDEAGLISDERMEKGSVKRGIYFSYIKHMGYVVSFVSLLGFIAFTSFESGANIWLSKWTSDPILNGTEQYYRTIWRLTIYGSLGLAESLAVILGTGFLVYGSSKAAELYHKQMLDSILRSPMSFFDTTPLGRIFNRFSTDMDTLDIHLIYAIQGWLDCSIYSIATFVIIGMNAPLFLAYAVPMGILYYIISRLHLNTSRQIQRLESTTKSPIYSHMLESINGVLAIKAFKIENDFIEKLEEILDNNIACYYYIALCNRWLRFWVDMIGAIVIFIAAWLALENRHTLGASVVALIITYTVSITDNMAWLVRTNTELENKSVAIERIDEYCHLQSEAPLYNPDNDPDGQWPENGEILFDNYSTRYRENLDLVLKEINLNVHASEKVGIVGRTGAGKSSLALALFRIIEPANGTILIDNVDLAKIGLHALRSKLTIIPQDPVLFSGSLRFNLDPNDEYNDDDIWTSLENSHLKTFVSNLPDGLQFSVEEGGSNLSAGQKQLICLSRALLKKAKILVLDEATAAVDVQTDRLIQDTISKSFADHTIVTIAHRINTIMNYDKIVVMDNGKIIEIGSPKTLLQNKQSQFFSMASDTGLI